MHALPESPTPPPSIGSGLSLFGVFDVASLPADVLASLASYGEETTRFRQLFLFGHVGRAMWDAVTAHGMDGPDPIDAHSVRAVDAYFESEHPGVARRVLYPGGGPPLALQALGELAGVHHASPFMVGVDARWGSWFAYRAVVVADTARATTRSVETASPCDACAHRVCIASCPAGALDTGRFDLERCVTHRRAPGSSCRDTCLARVRCPVGEEHRYEPAQIRYHYGRSLRTIEAYYAGSTETSR